MVGKEVECLSTYHSRSTGEIKVGPSTKAKYLNECASFDAPLLHSPRTARGPPSRFGEGQLTRILLLVTCFLYPVTCTKDGRMLPSCSLRSGRFYIDR